MRPTLSGEKAVSIGVRTVDGMSIRVIDGMFQPDLVGMVFETLKRLYFGLSEFDTGETAMIRHWNSELDRDGADDNFVMKHWRAEIMARTTEAFADRSPSLRRVHCNCHLYGDFQNAHTDITPGITALYFANPVWPEDWHGETIFYDRSGEACQAIAPRPGRLLMFDGALMHRGGVPSRKCFEPRLSVAFKFGADR